MHKTLPDRLAFPLLTLCLFCAFAFGGGGVGTAFGNLAVQLVALAILALRRESFIAFWRNAPLPLRGLILLTIALPAAQVLPLPSSVWTVLPAREAVQTALEQIGVTDGWRSLSLDPSRTLLALTALITPLAVLFAGWTIPRERLLDLGWIVVGLGLVTVLLGMFQLGAGDDAVVLHGARAPGKLLLGTFANRNTTALFLGFALGLAALLPAPRQNAAVLPVRLGVCALLLVAIALTQSRTGIVLAVLPVLVGAARALSELGQGRKGSGVVRTAMIGLGALALVGIGASALVVAAPGRIGEALERFNAKDDPRRYYWEDASFIAGRYWPVGAGMGTFDEVYQVDESLENLTERRPGRAHNDFLELTIEAGAPGIAIAALWLMLIGWLTWRARGDRLRWAAWASSTFLLAIALQSITDYPLRNQTILALAGLSLLLLVRVAAKPSIDE